MRRDIEDYLCRSERVKLFLEYETRVRISPNEIKYLRH